MDVEAAGTGRFQYGARQDEAVGGYHRDIGIESGKGGLHRRVLE